jgi:hypothetical protein
VSTNHQEKQRTKDSRTSGPKEGQTTFLKSADSHQTGRLHPGMMFKRKLKRVSSRQLVLFQHNSRGEGITPAGQIPLHLHMSFLIGKHFWQSLFNQNSD